MNRVTTNGPHEAANAPDMETHSQTHEDWIDRDPAEDEEAGPQYVLPTTFTGLRTLVLRADAGDPAVQPLLRALTLDDPDLTLKVLGGDLVTQNQRNLVEQFAGLDQLRHESINNQVKILREELAGPQASPLELLLIDRILICWLQVQLSDHEFEKAKGKPIKDGDYRDRLRNRAHNRFLSATKTLATIRKLNIPAIQVNIADQQINLTG